MKPAYWKAKSLNFYCVCSCKEISSYTIFFLKKEKKKNSGLVIYVVYGIKLQNYVPYNAFVWTIVHSAVVVSWIFYSVVLIIVCLCGLLLKYLNFMHFFF